MSLNAREAIVYRTSTSESTLQSAIHCLHENVKDALFIATDLKLQVSKIGPGFVGQYATGIAGRSAVKSSGATVSWSIRWDYDLVKGAHVNLSITQGSKSKDFAFLEEFHKRDEGTWKGKGEALFLETIRKLTLQVGYLGDEKNKSNRLEAAERGKVLWCQAYVPARTNERDPTKAKAALKTYNSFINTAQHWKDSAEDAKLDLVRRITRQKNDLVQYEAKQTSIDTELKRVKAEIGQLTGRWERCKAEKNSYSKYEDEMEELRRKLESRSLSHREHERIRQKVNQHADDHNVARRSFNAVNERRNTLIDTQNGLVESYNDRLDRWNKHMEKYERSFKEGKACIEKCINGVYYCSFQAQFSYKMAASAESAKPSTSLDALHKMVKEASSCLVGPKLVQDGKEVYEWVIPVRQYWNTSCSGVPPLKR